jgi:hypothetical protein
MTTFEKAENEDKVWSPTFGWGHIVSITHKATYPLLVQFFEAGNDETFTFQGSYNHTMDYRQSLFWDEVKIEAPKQPARMKLVNGVEIPDISFQPESGDEYYFPDPSCEDFYENTYYEDYEADRHRANYGLCYPDTTEGRAAAVLHAKAMLGIKE